MLEVCSRNQIQVDRVQVSIGSTGPSQHVLGNEEALIAARNCTAFDVVYLYSAPRGGNGRVDFQRCWRQALCSTAILSTNACTGDYIVRPRAKHVLVQLRRPLKTKAHNTKCIT